MTADLAVDRDRGAGVVVRRRDGAMRARHADLYSSSMHVIDLSKTGKKTKEHALIFNPLVSKILFKRSLLKKYTRADRKQRKFLQAVSRRIKRDKQQLLEEKRRLIEEKKLIRDQANKSQYTSYHRKCGHANLKGLLKFKRHGKVIAMRLPSKFLQDYRKDCPLCIAMKKRRKSLPKEPNSTNELNTLVPWEEVFSDSSGKFRLRSKQGNNYFTVFVCAKTGDKIAIPHVKSKHFPLVYFVLAQGVLRYLKSVKSRKIVWCASRVKFPFVPCELYAYSDASWADIVPQRKSSLNYLIFCNNAVFSWKDSLFSVLAMSSAEAELIAL